MEAPEISPPTKKRRLLPRTWRGWSALAGALILAMCLGAAGLYCATPPWYEPLDGTQVWVMDTGDIGQKLLTRLSGISLRGQQADERWEITQDQMNAAYSIFPSKPAMGSFSDPVFTFTPGKITISARTKKLCNTNSNGEVVSARFLLHRRDRPQRRAPWAKSNSPAPGRASYPPPGWLVGSQMKAILPLIARVRPPASQTEPGRRAGDILTYFSDMAQATIEDRPFSLELDGINHVVIKEIHVEQGRFSMLVGAAPRSIWRGRNSQTGQFKFTFTPRWTFMDKKEIANILASAGLRPQHQFGQNFMVDQKALAAITDAGEVAAGDTVLEVGPGVGNLTRLLSERAGQTGHILAVDIDEKLLPAARRHHETLTNITWMIADVLAGKHAVEPRVLHALREISPGRPLKLVSNLPYNAASPLVAELLVAMWRDAQPGATSPPVQFSRMAFTVQWEVGVRMSGGPHSRDYGPLGILIQSMAEVEIVRKIAPGAFWPPPKIHSALVVVKPAPQRMKLVRDAVSWQKFLAGIFSHRRQTLGNALKHYYGESWQAHWKRTLAEAAFDLLQRPENLAVAELLRLEGKCNDLAAYVHVTKSRRFRPTTFESVPPSRCRRLGEPRFSVHVASFFSVTVNTVPPRPPVPPSPEVCTSSRLIRSKGTFVRQPGI